MITCEKNNLIKTNKSVINNILVNYIITGIFRLGMASREVCVTALNNCNWNVEEAASTLCDTV